MSEEFKRSFVENVNVLANAIRLLNTEDFDEFKEFVENYADELSEIVRSKSNLQYIADDFKKGTYNGKRKLDVDLSLNKRGIKDTETNAEALEIWQNEQTTVYYYKAEIGFVDNSVLDVIFKNDDNEPIEISTSYELTFQLNKNNDFVNMLLDTRVITDAAGRVGDLLRITDINNKTSNITYIRLYVSKGDFVSVNPVYLWSDTTSVLVTLFEYLSKLELIPRYTDDQVADLIGMRDALFMIMNEINGLHYQIIECGNITDPIDTDESIILNYFDWRDKALLKANNLSDIPDKQAAINNLGLESIEVTGD
jgi:hypothetical protein